MAKSIKLLSTGVFFLQVEIPHPSQALQIIENWETEHKKTLRPGNKHNVCFTIGSGKTATIRKISLASVILALTGIEPMHISPRTGNPSNRYHTARALQVLLKAGYTCEVGENPPSYYPQLVAQAQPVKATKATNKASKKK